MALLIDWYSGSETNPAAGDYNVRVEEQLFQGDPLDDRVAVTVNVYVVPGPPGFPFWSTLYNVANVYLDPDNLGGLAASAGLDFFVLAGEWTQDGGHDTASAIFRFSSAFGGIINQYPDVTHEWDIDDQTRLAIQRYGEHPEQANKEVAYSYQPHATQKASETEHVEDEITSIEWKTGHVLEVNGEEV